MSNRKSVKFLTILVLTGIILPYFSAFALIGDITNIGKCALRNRLKQFLKDVLNEVVKAIKAAIRAAVCAGISYFTGGLVNCPQKVIAEGPPSQDIAKETIEDTIARCIARQALTRMIGGILDIVRDQGRDGGPVYVQNWRDFTLQGQQRGENIWRGLLYIAANGDGSIPPLLCSHIKESSVFNLLQPTPVSGLVQSGLNRRVDSLQEYLIAARCDPIVENNYAVFAKDFSQGGGWDMWERMLQPQNNIFGAIGLANEELIKQRAIEERINIYEATAHGFTGKRGENASDSCLSFDIVGRCVVYKNIQTPGFTLAESTNKALGSELDWIVSTDEINELLIDMFDVVVARLKNLGAPDAATPPVELPDVGGSIDYTPDPADVCVENCTQTYCTPADDGYNCSNAGSELNACVNACYAGPSGENNGDGGDGFCSDQGGTPNYEGNLDIAINTVITDNPDGIADALNTTANSFTFLNLVAQELQSAGFNATTSVLNGNDNPNNGDLIAVWTSGDPTMERYDAVIAAGDANRTIRQAAQSNYTGDIPLSCVQ